MSDAASPPSSDLRDRPAAYATPPEETRGRLVAEPESASRDPFQRDRDRIVHSGAFRKLQYKTQVFVYHVGDYYRTRLTHSLEVAQIARSISRSLGLTEDLAEAIALAHDLGHTPFGHAGEDALNAALGAAAPEAGGFDHNDQTVRVLTLLEQRYAGFDGLNLCWETLEGVVKHNGPLVPLAEGRALPPAIAALTRLWDLELDSQPGPEAQVAALADDIAYISHDIDDGLRANLFTIDELKAASPLVGALFDLVDGGHPGLHRRRRVHEVIRRLIDRLVGDLVAETRRRLAALAPSGVVAIRAAPGPVVGFPQATGAAVQALRGFLFQRMYRHYEVNRETSRARRVVRDLFAQFLDEPNTLPPEWQEAALAGDRAVRARVIADYIAGMTDRYALLEHRRLFDPGR